MNDDQLDLNTDFTASNKQYRMKIFLHKKDQDPETEGTPIAASNIELLTIKDDMFNIFPTVELHYDSRFGMNYERVSVEEYYSDKSMRYSQPHYIYEGAGKDFVYIDLIALPPQQDEAKNLENAPYPILKTDFVVLKKQETVFRNVFDPTQGTITILQLIPVSQWNLMLSYPQWTTGFDVEYQKKSGKKTGLCIKEILEKANMTIDDENFDTSGATINLTSLVNDSALDTIQKILLRHTCTTFDNDPSLLCYDYINDFYTLKSIKQYIEHDQLNDKIGAFEQITLRNHAGENNRPQVTNIPPYASEVTMDIESSLESITTSAPFAIVSRNKSTFVIDARQYDAKAIESHIKDNYYNEPAFGSGMDTSSILNEFNTKREEQPILTSRFPYWRESERNSINGNLIRKKYFAGNNIQLDVPGYGGERQVGRKFNVRMYAGAIDEFTQRLLGTYLTIGLETNLSARHNFYTNRIVGVKIFLAKKENFSTQSMTLP